MTNHNHVEPEEMAAWSEGRLPASEATAVESHLAGCERCQEVLAVFARIEPPPVESGVSAKEPVVSGFSRTDRWLGVRWRWAIPIAAAATAAAIWVATPETQRTDEFDRIVAPTLESPGAATAPAAADTAASPPPVNQSGERRDAPAAPLEDSARAQAGNKKAAPAATLERAETADAAEVRERAQDLNAEAAARQAAAAPFAAPAQATQAVSPDANVRWRIQPPNRLERSINAGKTWEAIALPEQLELTAVSAPAALTAIVTAADGRQFRTDDQGKTWNPVPR